MTQGFVDTGFDPVLAVELEVGPASTYAANFGSDHVYWGDIAGFPSSDVPKAEIVIGGPPCQGFSNLGTRDPSDPRNELWREVRASRDRSAALDLRDGERGSIPLFPRVPCFSSRRSKTVRSPTTKAQPGYSTRPTTEYHSAAAVRSSLDPRSFRTRLIAVTARMACLVGGPSPTPIRDTPWEPTTSQLPDDTG